MSSQTPVTPKKAFLIVNGADIFPLEKKVINIGRMEDNDIVLPNAHISRYHAQLRAGEGSFLLVDLNSTSGTSINGEKITRKVLAPGDVISMAGIPIIYGQTAGPEKLGGREAEPPRLQDLDSPTLGITDSVDLASIDHYLEMFDTSEEE